MDLSTSRWVLWIHNWQVGALVFSLTAVACLNLQAQSAQTGKQLTAAKPRVDAAMAQPVGSAKATNATAAVPNTTVLTVDGVCQERGGKKTSSHCKLTVNSADIDALAGAIGADNSPVGRRQLAINYTRLMAAASAAERENLAKDAQIKKEIETQQKLVRLEILARALYKQILAKAQDVPNAAVEKYYQEHQPQFEVADLERIYVPKMLETSAAVIADNLVRKNRVQELRAKAAAGEDFEQLQKQAFAELDVKAPQPSTKLTRIRRTNLPGAQATAFDLKPGEISEVIDATGAFTILKLGSKTVLPLGSVRAEITSGLQRTQLIKGINEATGAANPEFNLRYLDLAAAPQLFPPPDLTTLAAGGESASRLGRLTQMRPGMGTRRAGAQALPRR